MPLHHHTPFDREYSGDHEPLDEPDWRPHTPLIAAVENGEDLPRPPRKPSPPARRHWWGLGADCCYIVLKAGTYLMACWVIAMGLPLMFLLLLCMGQLDMAFLFLGSLFGAFVDATPDRQLGASRRSARRAARVPAGQRKSTAPWPEPARPVCVFGEFPLRLNGKLVGQSGKASFGCADWDSGPPRRRTSVSALRLKSQTGEPI